MRRFLWNGLDQNSAQHNWTRLRNVESLLSMKNVVSSLEEVLRHSFLGKVRTAVLRESRIISLRHSMSNRYYGM